MINLQVSYRIFVSRKGNTLCLNFGKKFVKAFDIKEKDFFIPCVIKRKIDEKDKIFGDNEFILRFRRRKEGYDIEYSEISEVD